MKKVNKQPLVSVIMPVYNAGEFLVEALESVFNQSFSDFEIIAVDDGSRDDSLRILRDLAKKDTRLRVFRNKENYGLGRAANLAISKAKGKFLTRFDADDLMPENRLKKQVKFLQKNSNVVAVGGQCLLIDEEGKVIGEKTFPLEGQEIKQKAFIMMSLQAGSMMINKELLPRDFLFYGKNYRYAEDHELLFKLFGFGKVANLPEVLLFYRQHQKNSVKKVSPKKVFRSIFSIRQKAIKKYGYDPGLQGMIINYLQKIVVELLPDEYICLLFEILRGMKKIEVQAEKFLPVFRLSR